MPSRLGIPLSKSQPKNSIRRILSHTPPQTIQSEPLCLFGERFKGSNFALSFSTGKNTSCFGVDGGGCDFIVGDFNFDNQDDFALKKFHGGASAQPRYDYYIQDGNGQFVRDTFLSDEIEFFAEINKDKKTLKISAYENVYQRTETIYKIDPATKEWRVIKSGLVGEIPGFPEPDDAWTVFISDRCFGLICFPLKTDVCYGIGSVEIPVHIYTLMGIGSGVPLLACAIYVYAQRRRHRAQAAKNRISPVL